MAFSKDITESIDKAKEEGKYYELKGGKVVSEKVAITLQSRTLKSAKKLGDVFIYYPNEGVCGPVSLMFQYLHKSPHKEDVKGKERLTRETMSKMGVTELRKILVEHGFELPSTYVKKADLIEMFFGKKPSPVKEVSPPKKTKKVKKVETPKPKKKPVKSKKTKEKVSKSKLLCDDDGMNLCKDPDYCNVNTGKCSKVTKKGEPYRMAVTKKNLEKSGEKFMVDKKGRVYGDKDTVLAHLKKFGLLKELPQDFSEEEPEEEEVVWEEEVEKKPKKKTPKSTPVSTPRKKTPKTTPVSTPRKNTPKSTPVGTPKKKVEKKKASKVKKCNDEYDPLICDDGKVCNAGSGRCIVDTEKNRKGKAVLVIGKDRTLIGDIEIIKKLQKELGGEIQGQQSREEEVGEVDQDAAEFSRRMEELLEQDQNIEEERKKELEELELLTKEKEGRKKEAEVKKKKKKSKEKVKEKEREERIPPSSDLHFKRDEIIEEFRKCIALGK